MPRPDDIASLVLSTLAQSSGAKAATDAVLVLGGLIVIVVVGGFVVMHLRRRFMGDRDADAQGLFMDDLRDLRKRGEISEEEYERARAVILARLSASMGRDGGPTTPTHPPRPAPLSGGSSAPSVRVARPGYDLTGEPLPRTRPPDSSDPPEVV